MAKLAAVVGWQKLYQRPPHADATTPGLSTSAATSGSSRGAASWVPFCPWLPVVVPVDELVVVLLAVPSSSSSSSSNSNASFSSHQICRASPCGAPSSSAGWTLTLFRTQLKVSGKQSTVSTTNATSFDEKGAGIFLKDFNLKSRLKEGHVT